MIAGACGNEGAVRFAGQGVGVTKTEGRLEICVDGSWGTVCNDGFDTNAAKVVCRQLGFPEDGEWHRLLLHLLCQHY